jgi:hypothetical protein
MEKTLKIKRKEMKKHSPRFIFIFALILFSIFLISAPLWTNTFTTLNDVLSYNLTENSTSGIRLIKEKIWPVEGKLFTYHVYGRFQK